MALVIDASVALKWLLPEPETPQALALIGAEPLLAPDFLLLECANVLARDVRRGLIDATRAEEAFNALLAVPLQLTPLSAHVSRAQALALQLGQTAYDSLYLALALTADAVLVTADMRFANVAGAAYPGTVRPL